MASPNRGKEKSKERVIGFDCEFLEPPPEKYIQSECPMCLLIIREPRQVECCGKKFCKSCIEHIKSTNKPCPTCKREGFSYFSDMAHKQLLYGLEVFCSYQKKGCEWTGELGQLDEHLNTDPQSEKRLDGCQFVEIYCLYNCGDQLQRQHIQAHQTEHCPKRPFDCEHCHDYESIFEDVIHNHWPVCGSFPVDCPNECGSCPQRQNLDSHVADECPLTTISCDFHHIGCAVKLPRKDMPDHLRENLLTHISLLAISQGKLLAENKTQQVEIEKQRTLIAQQVTTIEEQNNENTRYQLEITELKADVLRLEADIKQLKDEKKPQALNPIGCNIPLGPPILTMTNFQQRKRDDDQWCSPPVYTHHHGYKICLSVYANGHGPDKGTHVSVFVHFMKGEFDSSLQWPFHGVISYQLLDQINGSDHVTDSISCTDRSASRVTRGKRAAIGWGSYRFIAHSDLKPKYLQSNILRFQIHKVELK